MIMNNVNRLGKALLIALSLTVFLTACAPKQYPGEKLPKEQLATITLQTRNLEIREIDGKKTKLPNPTKSFLVGGGYVGMARALGTVKTQILPGPHTLLIAYRLNNCVEGGTGLVEFVAEVNHLYRIDCTIGPSTGNYTTSSIVGDKEIVTTFTDVTNHGIQIVVEDITNENAPVRVGEVDSTIALGH